jgi:hypothetical protein
MLSLGTAGELDFNDPEVRSQLINAFAAGAGVGLPVGGASNIFGKTAEAVETGLDPEAEPEAPPRDLGQENLDLLNAEQVELFPDTDLGAITTEEQLDLELPDVGDPRQGELDLVNPGTPVDAEITAATTEASIEQQGDLFDPTNVPFVPPEQLADADLGLVDTPAPVSAPVSVGEVSEPTPQEIIASQPAAPANTAMADALQAVEDQRLAQQAQEFAAQEQQFQQAEAALAAQPQIGAEQIELGVLPQQNRQTNPVGGASTTTNEPTLLIPHVIEDGPNAGQTVMRPVPVEEILAESQQGVDALHALRQCLLGVSK